MVAGTYQPGVPDPNDTSASTAPTFGSFDELNEYGVPDAIAEQRIIWQKRPPKVTPGTGLKMTGGLLGVPLPPGDLGPKEENMNTELTYAESVRFLYGQEPEQVGTLQLRLAAGGFFGDNPNYVERVPDNKTRNVWDNVLKTAMRTNRTPDEIIDEAIEANGGLEEGLRKRGMTGASHEKPKSVLVTHPDDIRRIAKEISTKTLGRGWNNEQLDKFVQTYQAMDRASGEAEGTRAAPASVEAAAEATARRDQPLQAQATDANNVMNMVLKAFSILGGGASENVQ